MMISMEINNQHYLNGITELARIAEKKPDELCRDLLCHAIDEFYMDRAGWEKDYVRTHTWNTVNRWVTSNKNTATEAER